MSDELVNPPENLEILRDISTDSIKTEAPDKAEIAMVIRKLKKNKATTDIEAEILQSASKSETILNEITELFQDIWEQQEVPPEWSSKHMIAIWKRKGSPKEPKFYRPIQIGKIWQKLISSLCVARISEWYHL